MSGKALRNQAIAVGSVFVAVFTSRLLLPVVSNDHYDRISRGRQILVYGEVPFRDFFDPGFFLTLYSSAAVQWLLGHNLFGEVLLSAVAIGAGFAVALWLAYRLAGSWPIALMTTLIGVATWPRLYNYDKVLFLPLALLVLWRYLSKPTSRRLAAVAIVTGIAALYRYDNGIYIGGAAVASLIATHWNSPQLLLRQIGVYAAMTLAVLAPSLFFIHLTAGLPEAWRQIAEYAYREGARSAVFRRPSLVIRTLSPQDVLTTVNAAAALFFLIIVLPFIALAGALRTPDEQLRSFLVANAVLSLAANLFLLRDPVEARIGDVATPAVPLAAWAIARALANPSARWIGAGVKGGLVGAVVALALIAGTLMALPATRGTDKLLKIRALLDSPPDLILLPSGSLAGLIMYYRECTRPDDRLLISLFRPEIFFFAGRAFAGGMNVFLAPHWTSEADQQLIVGRLRQQSVPVVLIELSELADFTWYPRVKEYLRAHYDEIGRSAVGDSYGDYRVLVRKGARPSGRWRDTEVPCFAGSS